MNQPTRIRLNQQHLHHPPPTGGDRPSVPPSPDMTGLGMPLDDPSLGAPIGTADPLSEQVRQTANQQLQYTDIEAEIERRAAERARQMVQNQRAASGPPSIPADAIDPVPVHAPAPRPQQAPPRAPQQAPSPAQQDMVGTDGMRFRNVGVPDRIADGLSLRNTAVTEFTNIDGRFGVVDTFTNVPQAEQQINSAVGFAFVSGDGGITQIQQHEVGSREDGAMLYTNEIQMERRVDPHDGSRLTFN